MNNETVQVAVEETLLPFTNFTNEAFIARWDSQEYTFPPRSTVPLVGKISNATPEQVQFIRKKFAKELAEREFYKSEKLKKMEIPVGQGGSFHSALTYTGNDLGQYIQQCLTPLPVTTPTVVKIPADDGRKYHKDKKGKPLTKILDPEESLLSDAAEQV